MDTDGSFTLGSARVGGRLSVVEFEGSALRRGADVSYEPTGLRARVDGLEVLGRRVIAGLEFGRERLSRVSLFVLLDGDGSSWSDWTLEQEMRRKGEHEALAAEMFGTPLEPVAMDVNGRAVRPMFPGPEHARDAVFGWGRVLSGYDSKGGMAQLFIMYGA